MHTKNRDENKNIPQGGWLRLDLPNVGTNVGTNVGANVGTARKLKL